MAMTKLTAKCILGLLEAFTDQKNAEEAREICLGASGARRLLMIAVPSSQAAGLANHLATTRTPVVTKTVT